jgi:putative oxidoreductase
MKKHIPTVAAVLLGALFLMASITYFLGMVPDEKFPEGSPLAMFMGAFGPTGYMTFVKVCELIGGILVIIPKMRNWGLLVLGPIIINILAFTVFIGGGVAGLANPMVIGIIVIPLYLLWDARKKFAGLLN